MVAMIPKAVLELEGRQMRLVYFLVFKSPLLTRFCDSLHANSWAKLHLTLYRWLHKWWICTCQLVGDSSGPKPTCKVACLISFSLFKLISDVVHQHTSTKQQGGTETFTGPWYIRLLTWGKVQTNITKCHQQKRTTCTLLAWRRVNVGTSERFRCCVCLCDWANTRLLESFKNVTKNRIFKSSNYVRRTRLSK